MNTVEIPEVVISRLPVYVRALATLAEAGRDVVSSQELGQELGVTPAQIRKDLSYFGRFGKQGRGYNVRELLERLRAILGLDRSWRMVLIGAGRLGQAILSYGGFAPEGFRVARAYDSDPAIIGRWEQGILIENVANLAADLQRDPADVAIVAVPAETAQGVIDVLVAGGVRAILNYAPTAVRTPVGVHVRQIDPVLALQGMTYYLKGQSAAGAGAGAGAAGG